MAHTDTLTESFFVNFMQKFETGLADRFATKEDFESLGAKIDRLTTSIDGYVRETQAWRQEQSVLRMQLERLTTTLLGKGVISEQELHGTR